MPFSPVLLLTSHFLLFSIVYSDVSLNTPVVFYKEGICIKSIFDMESSLSYQHKDLILKC